MKQLLSSLLILLGIMVDAQQSAIEFTPKPLHHTFYVTWGYNRSYYRDSDISFKGNGYKFTIRDVQAIDDPERFDANVYLNPSKFTIPQFNFRIGYHIKENLSISLGWDHMKYVMRSPQVAVVNGYIDPELSLLYGREYEHELIVINPDLLRYEHTDGLNFVGFGVEKHAPFFAGIGQRLELSILLGINAGLIMPWTDVTFLEQRHATRLHLAGWGASATMGLRLKWRNTFFLHYQVQPGFLDLRDILLEDHGPGKAEQKIWFTELSLSGGAYISLRKRMVEATSNNK